MKNPDSAPGYERIATIDSKSALHDSLSIFVGFIILGGLLGLFLMIFIPGLRSFGAFTLFALISGTILTILYLIAQFSETRSLWKTTTSHVNKAVTALTGNRNDEVSVPDFREFIEWGRPRQLSVNGVPGTSLVVTGPEDAREVFLVVQPPEYATESFDRLFAAATQDSKRGKDH